MRRILLVGGAPRVQVDAVRYLCVSATGATAVALRARLGSLGRRDVDLLLASDAAPAADAIRFATRDELDRALRGWIGAHADGVVVMSAAVNDYELAAVDEVRSGQATRIAPGTKAQSGADELVIRLRPAAKLIDQLRGWGLTGPLVGFKYEDRDTVLASAEALRRRVGAELVVANSLCGELQALVDASGATESPGREALLSALARRLANLAAKT